MLRLSVMQTFLSLSAKEERHMAFRMEMKEKEGKRKSVINPVTP